MSVSSARLVQILQAKGIKNKKILRTIENTPRHLFIDEGCQAVAYEDSALPIHCGQTISQPYIVARMTELLLEKKPANVLEIGTGSGYQTAILAQLVSEVYSIERIPELFESTKKRLQTLNLMANVKLMCSDGSLGCPAYAPFDAIIVTAAGAELPEQLLIQLSENGRLVAPVGNEQAQFLYVVDKTKDGYISKRLDAVRFVPLIKD